MNNKGRVEGAGGNVSVLKGTGFSPYIPILSGGL